MIENKNETPHLEELTGSPSAESVSIVAKGGKPETVNEEIIRQAKEIHGRRYEGDSQEGDEDETGEGPESNCEEIQEAYAKLFEGLATIARM